MMRPRGRREPLVQRRGGLAFHFCAIRSLLTRLMNCHTENNKTICDKLPSDSLLLHYYVVCRVLFAIGSG